MSGFLVGPGGLAGFSVCPSKSTGWIENWIGKYSETDNDSDTQASGLRFNEYPFFLKIKIFEATGKKIPAFRIETWMKHLRLCSLNV